MRKINLMTHFRLNRKLQKWLAPYFTLNNQVSLGVLKPEKLRIIVKKHSLYPIFYDFWNFICRSIF